MIGVGFLEYTTGYRRAITIDHTKVGSTLTNYTALVSITGDANLKSVSNGGLVIDTGGNDIVFSANGAIASLLSWEIESYDPAAGDLKAWVKVPTVSSTTDTVFFMNYGNPAYSAFQGGSTGAAWSRYSSVFHLGDATTLSLADSSASGNTLTNTGTATASAGMVRGGADFGGTARLHNDAPIIPNGSTSRSMSFWFKMSTNVSCSFVGFGSASQPSGFGQNFYIYYDGTHIGLSRGDSFVHTFNWTYDTNWHHLLIDDPNAVLANVVMYLDGVNQGATGGSPAALITGVSGSNRIVLGGNPDAVGNFKGSLDEFRLTVAGGNLGSGWAVTEYNNINSPSTFMTVGSQF